jgi:protein TonB
VARSEAFGAERLAGLAMVALLHGAALYGLWGHRIPVTSGRSGDAVRRDRHAAAAARAEGGTQAAARGEAAARRAAPAATGRPRRPCSLAGISRGAAAPPAPVVEAPPRPAGPVTLGAELSVSCPERRPPAYPPLSRRLGEEGKTVLRVELDAQGAVSAARVPRPPAASRAWTRRRWRPCGAGAARRRNATAGRCARWRCSLSSSSCVAGSPSYGRLTFSD